MAGTYAEMLEHCFGEREQEPSFEDPAMVSKHMNILRPYARRACKSIGSPMTNGDMASTSLGSLKHSSAYQEAAATPPPTNQEVSSSSGITRTGTMPSGRTCRYMRCQLCSSEVVDALVSAHVYQNHLRAKGAVQCPYCEFSVYYAIAEVCKSVA